MAKLIGRSIVVLLVACLVACAIYWVIQENPSIVGERAQVEEGHRGGIAGGGGRQGHVEEGSLFGDEPSAGLSSGGRGEGGRGRGEAVDVTAGLTGVARSLGIIAVITLGVVALQKALQWIATRRRQTAAHRSPV